MRRLRGRSDRSGRRAELSLLGARAYVLGASDPEMTLIKDVLTRAQAPWTQALCADGKAVSPTSAYGFPYALGAGSRLDAVVFVECFPDEESKERILKDGIKIRTIDHHRPGDPGYGQPPLEYLWASSIGQVVRSLTHDQRIMLGAYRRSKESIGDAEGRLRRTGAPVTVCTPCDDHVDALPFELSQEIRFTAAADHCLGAAYAGDCRC
jgi:hypothetical protein